MTGEQVRLRDATTDLEGLNLRERWLAPLLIVAAGMALRVLWVAVRGPEWTAGGEAFNAAVGYARNGYLSDAYGPGQGYTAHVSVIPAIIAGTVYRTFGVATMVSEIILGAWALSLVAISYLFTFRAFILAGVPRSAGLLGLAACAFLPLNFIDESVTYRVWEGGLAAALGAIIFHLVVRYDRTEAVGWSQVLLLSVLTALLFFINPAFGLAAYLACLVLTVRRLPLRRWLPVGLVAALALALVLTPWAVRNQHVIGAPVLLRSNFGLELALANHPAAAGPGDQRAVFVQRLEQIHPYESRAALARVRQVGEVAYAQQLGATAKAWMAAHPLDVARLMLRHLGQYFFPPAWLWHIYDDESVAVGAKQAMFWAVSLFGLLGIGLGALRRRERLFYLAIMALAPCLPYVIVQPVLRYRYLVYAPLLFFGAYLATELLRMAWRSPPAPAGGRVSPRPL